MAALPPPVVTQGENGLRIITEYKYNDEGQKVKVSFDLQFAFQILIMISR